MSDLKEAYTQGMFDKRDQQTQLLGIKSQKRFGMESMQNELNQQVKQTALQKESAMVESLAAAGTTQLRQAGKSKGKALQANMSALQRGLMALDTEMSGRRVSASIQMAELHTDASLQGMSVGINLKRMSHSIANAEASAEANLRVMRANMESKINQSERNLKQISLERSFADLNTRAGMMLEPARLPYDPEPVMPPERVFVDRMKAIPGFVPPAVTESRFAGVLNTLGQVASIATPFV